MPEFSLINEKEVLYHRRQFDETLSVQGISAKIYPINRESSEAYDFYSDVVSNDTSYGDPIDIKVLFEEVPTIRTLKSLGWYIEGDDLPYIAYIPTEYKDLYGNRKLLTPIVDDCIVLRDNPIDGGRSKRSYQIKDLRGLGYPNTIYYAAKLAPYRVNIEDSE